jgi:hypothetical protein
LTTDLADGLSRFLKKPVLGRWAIADPTVEPGRGAMNSAQRVAAVMRRYRLEAEVPAGPLLLVDDHGWVAHTAGIANQARIAVPHLERPLTVPGLGLCLPERLADGWLVRPAGRESRIAMTLDLTGAPAVEVSGGRQSWRSPLTGRHAEILLLLYGAGRAGLTAAALSRGIHGDADHVVAVRAEVSRLRRTLGGVLESAPYRIASSVDLTVALGAESPAGCAFVVRSASPAVRALAG